MKAQKILSLDSEIIEELKKLPNASKLINNLLLDYFNTSSHLKKQELINKRINLEAEYKKIENNLNNINSQIEMINKDEARVKETFKNIPKEIMDDFRFFEKMNLETCFNRYREVWSRKFDIKWEEIKQAFYELRGTEKDAQ